MQHYYDHRSDLASGNATICVVDAAIRSSQTCGMFGTDELLAELKARGVRHVDIADALKLPTSRVAEMYAGTRRIRLEEAKTLVDTFGLAESQTAPPINEQTARLLILHVANTLGAGVSPEDPIVQELALDFQAFSKFARAHLPAPSPDATSGFLYGRRASHPVPPSKPGSPRNP